MFNYTHGCSDICPVIDMDRYLRDTHDLLMRIVLMICCFFRNSKIHSGYVLGILDISSTVI